MTGVSYFFTLLRREDDRRICQIFISIWILAQPRSVSRSFGQQVSGGAIAIVHRTPDFWR
jgi:hypothetical protein